MTNQYDIIVVGAGPGGSAAAIAAAEQNVSVLLLEEHEHIGIPVACAEGLSKSTIKEHLTIKPEWIAQPLQGAIIRGPSGREFKIEYPGCGWILNRTVFDPALADIAGQRGATVKRSARVIGVDGNEITVQENGALRYYRFKQLIGADGITSRVGRWMGIDTRLGLDEIEVCAEYLIENITIDPDYVTLIVGDDYAPGGYAWIFPKSSTAANIGLGIAPIKTRTSAKILLDQWVHKEFPNGRIASKIYGGIPVKVMQRFSGNNFLLVGDAARLADPLSGAGIATAVKSGFFAGQTAAARLHGKKDTFEALLREYIIPEIRYHQRVRKGYVKLTDREFEIIFDISRKIFKDTTVTDINIRRVVTRILTSSPRILRIAFSLLL